MVKSKFKFWSVFAIVSCLIALAVLTVILFAIGVLDLPIYASIPVLAFVIFFIVWLFFGELRTKLVKVNVDTDFIMVKKFAGLGIEKKYSFKEFAGYKISILPSEYQDFEYLYVMLDGRKAIKISQFYHSNYAELKQAIIKKTKKLGIENFSFVRELREIFVL